MEKLVCRLFLVTVDARNCRRGWNDNIYGMTLAAAFTFLGLIAIATVLWQMATLRTLASLQPDGRVYSGRAEPDTIRATRPDPVRPM